MSTKEDLDLYNQLTTEHPDRDFILISNTISRQLHYSLSALVAQKKHDNCTVFLTTFGGDPHGGYRIGRCLRHHYKHVRLVVPSLCKSAGTLVAIAADELAIGDLGELGPLDVQVRKLNEMAEHSSGLDLSEAMEVGFQHTMKAFRHALVDIRGGTRVSTRLAGEFAAKIAASVATPIYSQIDPNRVGEMQRAVAIALEYGTRLNKLSKSLKSGDSLKRLVVDYPCHSFVIDRKEATEIFNKVTHPSKIEIELYENLWHVMNDEVDYGPILVYSHNEKENHESNGNEQQATPASGRSKRQPPARGTTPGSSVPTSAESIRSGKDHERESGNAESIS